MIVQDLFEAPQLCPECGGVSFSDLILAEKKDACYYKVKASAKVWPSAYASGRLVQCRKKGADNYGNSKNEGVAEGSEHISSMIQQYEDMVELVYDLPPGRKKNIAIDKRDALEAQIEAMPGGKEALRKWAKSYNDAMDEGVAEAAGLYGSFTVTINTGERPQSRTKTKKFRREDDAILWAQDWLDDFPQYSFATAEVTDPEGNVVWTTDEQGVAEGNELAEEFDLIESIIDRLAEHNGVDAELIWEDLESLTDDELYVFAVTTPLMEDWQKANKQDRTDGMSRKAVNAYRRENPGSKLKTAVTTKPSKLKRGSKASKRRKSYCSRSRGQMKMHSISCAKTPDKAICKARRRWNCESVDLGQGVAEGEVTRTPKGLIHRATDRYGAGEEPFNPHNPGKYVRDLDSVDKKQVKDLDASMGINWRSHGPKGIEVDEQGMAQDSNEKIGGRYDPDEFDSMVQRLKKLAGAGPMKTVYDQQKRVYRNVPVAQQPDKK